MRHTINVFVNAASVARLRLGAGSVGLPCRSVPVIR